jgi:hypothetical protein
MPKPSLGGLGLFAGRPESAPSAADERYFSSSRDLSQDEDETKDKKIGDLRRPSNVAVLIEVPSYVDSLFVPSSARCTWETVNP